MSTRKQSFFEAVLRRFEPVLARLSLGYVPVDGSNWFDPKERGRVEKARRAEVPDAVGSPVSPRLSRRIGKSGER